jgi:hypothetical protein
MHDITDTTTNPTMTTAVCRRCRFHPASPRIAGYCSWDCYEADDDASEMDLADDIEGQKAAWGAAVCCA